MNIIFLVMMTILASTFNGYAQNEVDSSATSKDEKTKTIRSIKVGSEESVPPSPPPPPPPPKSEEREFFLVVEKMPMFPDSSCRLLSSHYDQKDCSNQKLMDYIYQTIQYPDTAKAAGITGMVVLSFIVETDGQISTIKILRDPGGTLGKEGVRVINQMIIEKGPWIPGRQRGKAVPTKMNLPIRFKLD